MPTPLALNSSIIAVNDAGSVITHVVGSCGSYAGTSGTLTQRAYRSSARLVITREPCPSASAPSAARYGIPTPSSTASSRNNPRFQSGVM